MSNDRRRTSGYLPVPTRKMGEMLLREKMVSPEQLQNATEQAQKTGEHLHDALATMGYLEGTMGSVFLGSGVFVGLMIYSGYRNRKPWAYWPAVCILFLASLLFAILAFANVLQALLSGIFSGLLLAFLMGWAALGSSRRAMFHWHPGYRMGYLNLNPMDSFNLQDGEMLAACPSCLAVLAIQPTMLGHADRCPHCSAPLVSQELISKYNDEEA